MKVMNGYSGTLKLHNLRALASGNNDLADESMIDRNAAHKEGVPNIVASRCEVHAIQDPDASVLIAEGIDVMRNRIRNDIFGNERPLCTGKNDFGKRTTCG